MNFVANQRIKHRGQYLSAGDPLELTEEELAALPNGSVSPAEGEVDESKSAVDGSQDALKSLSAEEHEKLKAAVDKLKPADFKKDGGIRAEALRALNADLGFELTEAQVAGALAAIKS